MKTLILILLLIASSAFAQSVPDEFLVRFKEGANLESVYANFGAVKIKTLAPLRVDLVRVPAAASAALQAALRKNPQVDFIEPNFTGSADVVPNDPSYSSQWHLPKINAPAAWNGSTGSQRNYIAIIDSGIDQLHADLSMRVGSGYNFLSNNYNTQDTGALGGHGTAVSGAAAAMTNNSVGVAGVDWETIIMPLVVLNASNVATAADVAEAVNYAADHGAKIINISLGFTTYSSTLQTAVNYAYGLGSMIVASAGNSNSDALHYPASMSNVIAVGATDQSDVKASFSNYGSWLDVVAPGVTILTTKLAGGYWNTQGTSLAAPLVSGLLSIMWGKNNTISQANMEKWLKNCAVDLGAAGFDNTYGYGRINAQCSVEAVP